ncbi:PerC family transcriptional regulator [Klebsiella michiganensis]|uniref:PerC family transcriptional regulator n=1 Tax=Klebsiella michiganensis TaxID=1134687 RepID=UPI003D039220
MKISNRNINLEAKDKREMKDSKAEALEAKGLYRRAAQRWLDVMLMSHDRNDQDIARQRHNECIRKSKRPPQMPETLSGLSEAAKKTQIRMGIKPKDGRGFNDHYRPPKKRRF